MVYPREVCNTFIGNGIPLSPRLYYLSSDGYWYYDHFVSDGDRETNIVDGYKRVDDPVTIETLNGIWSKWEDFYKKNIFGENNS